MKEVVFVTGMGMVTPLRPFSPVDTVWDALCSGEDGVRPAALPVFEIEGEWPVAAVDTSYSRGHPALADKLNRIAEAAIRMALRDAEMGAGCQAGLSVGTVLGNVLSKEMRLATKNVAYEAAQESLGHVASHLAGKFDLRGPKITVSTACSSGTDAIGIAARKIEAGEAEAMIAGGVDVLNDLAVTGFNSLKALTGDKVRPFDKNRTGLALGEGAGFLLLESESHAVRRRARVRGRVMGYASRADANHLTGPHREGRGLADAMVNAISGAKVEPRRINYINAHGTGTPYNDLMETKAIKRVFGPTAYDIPISSTKSMLGHSLGAAGAIEAICCLLAIRDGVISPTINLEEADPECDLDYVPRRARRAAVKTAMSLSAGFGGQNAALVLGEP